MQIKTTITYHLTPVRTAIIKKTTNWEKIFTNHVSDMGLVTGVCKGFLKCSKRQPNIEMRKRLEYTFFEESIQIAKRHMKRFSMPLVIMEMSVKTTETPFHTHYNGYNQNDR